MKFQLVAGHQGVLDIGVGPFAARFEPGVVVEVKDEAFAAHLAGRSELEVVDEGAGSQVSGAGEEKAGKKAKKPEAAAEAEEVKTEDHA